MQAARKDASASHTLAGPSVHLFLGLLGLRVPPGDQWRAQYVQVSPPRSKKESRFANLCTIYAIPDKHADLFEEGYDTNKVEVRTKEGFNFEGKRRRCRLLRQVRQLSTTLTHEINENRRKGGGNKPHPGGILEWIWGTRRRSPRSSFIVNQCRNSGKISTLNI